MPRVTVSAVLLALGLITGGTAVAQDLPSLPPPLRSLGPEWLRPIVPPAVDPFGYPANVVDRRRLPSLLRTRDFAGLERELDALKASVMRDIRYEYLLLDSCTGFTSAHPAIAPLLDAWIARMPSSSNARAARAQHLLGRAFRARGTKWASDTPPQQLEEMAQWAAKAWQDAVDALTIDSTHLCAYDVLIDVARLLGEQELARQVIDRATSVFPGTWVLRTNYMYNLEPRWGGSFEAMAAFAEEAAGSQALNPRLVNLRGHVIMARAAVLELAGAYPLALQECDRALAIAPELGFLWCRARVYFFAKDYVRAIHDLHAALLQRPQDVDLLEMHSNALFEVARQTPRARRDPILKRGIEQLMLLQQIDPLHRAAGNLRYWIWYRQNCRNPAASCD
jgi:tetratricopeptide (TPR) repeat protein